VSLAVWIVGVSSLTWEMRKPTWFFFGLLMAQCGSIAEMKPLAPLVARGLQKRIVRSTRNMAPAFPV